MPPSAARSLLVSTAVAVLAKPIFVAVDAAAPLSGFIDPLDDGDDIAAKVEEMTNNTRQEETETETAASMLGGPYRPSFERGSLPWFDGCPSGFRALLFR
jgi:hypothetical protein